MAGGLIGGDGGLTIGYGGTGSPTGGAIIAGNVGIGTSNPGATLQIAGVGNVRNTCGGNYETGVSAIMFKENPAGGCGDEAYISYGPNGGTEQTILKIVNQNDAAGGNTDDIAIMPAGSLGVGTTNPVHKLDVVGNIAASGDIYLGVCGNWISAYTCSDRRYKRDILPLNSVLADVLKLQGVTYNWRQSEFPDLHFNDRKQIGLIAQDVEKIFPEIVNTNNEGYKSVDYGKFAPVLIEAIKELNSKNEQQQQVNENQQNEINALKANNSELKSAVGNLQSENAALKSDIEKIKFQLGIEAKK